LAALAAAWQQAEEKISVGSDARIYVFDYDVYTREVVPTIRKLLLTGELEPWARTIWDEWYEGYWSSDRFDLTLLRNTDLDRHCTYLTHDLACRGPGKSPQAPWDERACRTESCQVRRWCPFHNQIPQRVIEELHILIRIAVEKRCLGKSQFLGRSIDAGFYSEFLDKLGLAADHSIRVHLQALRTRGLVMGYAWANCDGIHGWLDPDETRELAENLGRLPLPQYEASFAVLDSMFEEIRRRNQRYTQLMKQRDSPELKAAAEAAMEKLTKQSEAEWPPLSLSFVRSVAAIASRDGKAVLWGNDIA
jgi:hypothetical protein